MSRAETGGSVDFPERLEPGTGVTFPPKWTLSTSWQRAQRETDRGGPVNVGERMVWLSDGDEAHRVTWALTGRTLVADCDCRGYWPGSRPAPSRRSCSVLRRRGA